jgi:hypothetical protein
MQLARETGTSSRLSLYLLIAITAAYCIWVLSLPLFPTTDGPMHLYYIHVIRALFSRTPNVYQSYYYIKHLLPPYSGYYYTQIALSTVFSDLVADKLVICLYFILSAFGFRYLATAIGPSGGWMALLATPLLLNWPLMMGFVNYLLATAIAMWAVGLWWRVSGTPQNGKKILFVALVYLAMLSHPVPLIFIMGCCFVELFVRILQRSKQADKVSYDKYLWQDAGYLFVASLTFVYVKLFTLSNIMQQAVKHPRAGIHAFSDNAFSYVEQWPVDVFKGHDFKAGLYRTILTLILIVPLALAAKALWRNIREGVWTKSDTWIALAFLALVLMPAVPQELNHAFFFAYRLVVVVWLVGIAAGSIFAARSKYFGWGVGVFSVASTAFILVLAQMYLAPIANTIAQVKDVPEDTGDRGLVLTQDPYKGESHVNYDPFYWAGAHYFRIHDKVLYNSPWMQLPTIPIGPKATMPYTRLDGATLENLGYLRKTMDLSSVNRNFVLSHASFVLIIYGVGPRTIELDPVLAHFRQAGTWGCTSEGWFKLCDHNATVASR